MMHVYLPCKLESVAYQLGAAPAALHGDEVWLGLYIRIPHATLHPGEWKCLSYVVTYDTLPPVRFEIVTCEMTDV